MALVDLTGKRFGRLTVIERAPNSGKRTVWKCICDCGNSVNVHAQNLKTGHTTSCGCYWYTVVPPTNKVLNTTHGKSKTKLFHIWANMRYRCNNPKCKCYKNYGGRGIKVCQEWDSSEAFMKWAHENGYEEGLSIDRINNDGNYEPSNCRWVGMKQQINNRRSNHYLTYDGDTHTLQEWSEITGIKWTTLKERLKHGWSVEKALTTKVQTKSKEAK